MVRKVLAEFDAIDGPFINKLRRIDKSINRFERGTLSSFGRVEKGMNGMLASATKLRTVTGIFATGFGTSLAVGFLDQSKQIRNALREAGDSSQEMYEDVYRASVRSLAGFKDFAQGVQRMQKALGSEQGLSETIRDMETLNKLLALSGKTAQERSSTMIQFSQALQAGYLQGEELRAIRENAPIEFTRAIAKEAGGTIQDLKELAKAGSLTTDVMIRALKSLEEEADLRFGKIQVTINDATKLFQSGAIIAAEGFDKGLGFSRVAVTGLKQIGDILGENAEASETFGKAVKVAGAIMATSFAGRRINTYTNSLKNLSRARLDAAVAAGRELAVSNQKVVVRKAALVSANANLTSLQRTAPASAKAAKAAKAVTTARTALTAATVRATAATYANDAAQRRLLLTSRVLAGGLGILKGAFAFLGGLPGLLLIAGTAMLSYSANIETAAEKMSRLTQANNGLEGSTENARAVMERLNEAIAERGDLSLTAAAKIVSATKQEFEAKQTLLRLETKIAAKVQAERADQLVALRSERDQLLGEIREKESSIGSDRTVSGAFRKWTLETIDRDRDRISEITDQVDGLQAVYVLAAQEISDANEIISNSFDVEGPTEFMAQVDKAAKLSEKFIRQNMSSEQERMAVLEEVRAARAVLIQQYGEESAQVQNLDAAMAQFQIELDKTKSKTDALTGAAKNLHNVLTQLGSLHLSLSDRLTGARAKIAAIGAGASASQAEAMSSGLQQGLNVFRAGGSLTEIAGAYTETVRLNTELNTANELVSKLTSPAKSGGGGGGGRSGGGRSAINELEEDAISFIESMMTTEERRAEKMREAIHLREKMIATYGEEHVLVAQVSDAIVRMNDDIDNLSSTTDDFFKDLSNQLANSGKEWNGWGDLVGNILASLINKFGANFFEALFTPGKQTGSDLGTKAGNWVTGQVAHTGGIAGGAGPRRRVSASTFNGGIAGLKPNEGIGILERGEVNIPNGARSSGSSGLEVHIHENAEVGQHRVQKSNGRVDVFLKKAVAEVIGGGGADVALRDRFNMKPAAKGA